MDWKFVTASALMAAIMGVIVFFASLSLLDFSVLVGVVATLIGFYYLTTKSTVSQALSSGFYINAILLFITPVALFLPTLISEGELSTLASLYGLFISGIIAAVGSVVFAATGRFFQKRARPN